MPIIVHSIYHPGLPNEFGEESDGHVTFKCDFSEPDGYFWPKVPYYEVSMFNLRASESGWITTCCIIVSHRAVLGRYALVVRRTLPNRLWFRGYKLAQKVRDLDYSLLYGMFKLGILDVPENTWIMHWWEALPSFSLNPETMSKRVTERNNEERDYAGSVPVGPHVELNEPGADPPVSVEDPYEHLIRQLSAQMSPQEEAPDFVQRLIDRLNDIRSEDYVPAPLQDLGPFRSLFSYVWAPPDLSPVAYPFLKLAVAPERTPRMSNWSWSHHRHPFYGQGMGSDDERGYIDRGYDGRS